jgi:hypothetical protein
MRSVLEQLGPDNTQAAYSICNSDFGPATLGCGVLSRPEFRSRQAMSAQR